MKPIIQILAGLFVRIYCFIVGHSKTVKVVPSIEGPYAGNTGCWKCDCCGIWRKIPAWTKLDENGVWVPIPEHERN
jgi:hypothetical protein